MFAVDAGSTQAVAQVIQKYKLRDEGVKGGGYDLLEPTIELLAADQIDFTIDQQPYLQGFLPVLQLFMYKASETLTGVADVNTGLKFLDKTTVEPYIDDEVPLRGQRQDRRRHASSRGGRDRQRRALAPRGRRAAPGGSGGRRARRARPGLVPALPHAPRGQRHRHHDRGRGVLRGDHGRVPDVGELQDAAALLRAVRDPRGRRGLPDDQRGDRPLDRRGLPVHAVPLLRGPRLWACRSCRRCRWRMLGVHARGRHQRRLHGGRRHQLVRHDARHAARAPGLHADHLRRRAGRHAGHVGHGRADHVRERVRRRVLLRADLGAGHRDRAAGRAQLHALGHLHGGRRRQPPRRGRGGHQGPPGHHPQLHHVRRAARASSACSRPCARRPCSPTRPERTPCCSTASPPR